MMRAFITMAVAAVLATTQSACTPRETLQSEQYADPIAGIAAEFAAIQADEQNIPPTRTAKQRIAALRSLIAQARVAQTIYADSDRKTRAASLLAEMEAAEATLFKATFVLTGP